MKETKLQLQLENEVLRTANEQMKDMNTGLIQSGLQYRRQFEEAYMLLERIPGLSSHPLWLEVQDFLAKYETINHPTYGQMIVPK